MRPSWQMSEAEAVLRDRLSPPQLADLDDTGWFNHLAANGRVYRIEGRDELMFPNVTDEAGRGRTVYSEGGPSAPSAAALMVLMGTIEGCNLIERLACSLPPNRARAPEPGRLAGLYGYPPELTPPACDQVAYENAKFVARDGARSGRTLDGIPVLDESIWAVSTGECPCAICERQRADAARRRPVAVPVNVNAETIEVTFTTRTL